MHKNGRGQSPRPLVFLSCAGAFCARPHISGHGELRSQHQNRQQHDAHPDQTFIPSDMPDEDSVNNPGSIDSNCGDPSTSQMGGRKFGLYIGFL